VDYSTLRHDTDLHLKRALACNARLMCVCTIKIYDSCGKIDGI